MTIQRHSTLGLRPVSTLYRSSTAMGAGGIEDDDNVAKARCSLNNLGAIRLRTRLTAEQATT